MSKNWQKGTKDSSQIKQGSPSLEWTSGLARRFDLIEKYIDIKDKKFLDTGCGVGTFMAEFSKEGADVYGVDIDEKKVKIAQKQFDSVLKAPAEKLPFNKNFFDIVLLHEVIEHVNDDKQTIRECFRVLRSGGYLIIFAPNRLWPFETHGVYLRGKYHFGNIPLVTYLPDKIYKKLTPHVRNYRRKEIFRLFKGQSYRVIAKKRIFPGFDKLSSRIPIIGKLIQLKFGLLGKTPLSAFGISHFIIIQKI